MPLPRDRPFTRAEARAAGLGWRALTRPPVRRLFHDSYVLSEGPVQIVDLARAAVLAGGPGAAASHGTAAALLGLPAPPDDDVHIIVPPGSRRIERAGIRVHVGSRALSEVQGVLVTRSVDTFLDGCRTWRLVDALVLGDALVRHGYGSPEVLRRAAAHAGGTSARRAREVAALVRVGVDSPPETRLRLLLVLAGLPEPQVNPEIVVGGRRRRIDLAYPAQLVAVEYDGRHHIESTDRWHADLRRREELEAAGWRVVVVVAQDLARDPECVVRRVEVALRARGLGIRLRADPRALRMPH